MSRATRRQTAAMMRKQAGAWPEHLVAVPESEWPPRPAAKTPLSLWRSRYYLAQVYAAPAFGLIEVRQLTVNRVTIGASGHWDADIPWDDLQRCKREIGCGDWYAVEVYPRDRDIEYVANMRHLWLLAEPLAIGWFK